MQTVKKAFAVDKPEETTLHGRHRNSWEENMECDLIEIV
jgi:hypothetical protein